MECAQEYTSMEMDSYDIDACAKALLPPKETRPNKPLPDLKLGIKQSFTTRQWRERERRQHKKALETIESPLALDIVRHENRLKRAEMILSYGKNNKEKAIKLKVDKIRQDNRVLAERLEKVKRAVTEITNTNRPVQSVHMRALKNRTKYLSAARRVAQTKLDSENSIILNRINNARGHLSNRKTLEQEYKRHSKVKRNLCRLEVGYSYDGKKGQPNRSNKRPSRKLNKYSLLPDVTKRPTTSAGTMESENLHQCKERDRGQVVQRWIDIQRIVNEDSSETETESDTQRALLLGIPQPEQESILFELHWDSHCRSISVPYHEIRKCTTDFSSFSIADICSKHLRIHAPENQLVWCHAQ